MEAEGLITLMRSKWDVPRNAAVYNALVGAQVRADQVERALVTLEAGAYTRSHFCSTCPYFAPFRSTEAYFGTIQPKLTIGCGSKVLKLSSDVSDVSRRSSS
jgi:hypothetical protein